MTFLSQEIIVLWFMMLIRLFEEIRDIFSWPIIKNILKFLLCFSLWNEILWIWV